MIIEKKEEMLKRELPLFVSSKTGDFMIISEYYDDLQTAYVKKLHCLNFSEISQIVEENKEHEYFLQVDRLTFDELEDEYVIFDNADMEKIIIPLAEVIESNVAQLKKEYLVKKEKWEQENKDKEVEDIEFREVE